jgi:plastocyanin
MRYNRNYKEEGLTDMNKNTKWLAITGAVIVAIVIVSVAVMANRKHNTDDNKINTGTSSDMSNMDTSTGSSSSDSSSSDNGASTSSPTATTSVEIKDFAFSPANITVKIGDTVTWTNKDSAAHTVTADSGSSDAPSSGNIAAGGTYSFKFTKAATYIYHCAIHPNMQGSVTVTE